MITICINFLFESLKKLYIERPWFKLLKVNRISVHSNISKITFFTQVCSGAGLFAKEIALPSPNPALTCISDWPNEFAPGTLNLKIDTLKWPNVAGLNFQNEGVQCLDLCPLFKPALYLDYTTVLNNTINPTSHDEFAGDLQYWRAELQLKGQRETIRCYMLRRVRSGYRDQIELISDIHLRNMFSLENGTYAKLSIFNGR